jgi:translation initiation factor IF-1
MKRTLLAASVAVLLFAGFAEVLSAAPDLRREELLGQREVDFRADNDVIEVGRSEGRFQKIRVVVRGAPIELRDMKVVFEDDSVVDVPRRSRILRENSDFVIDLPGDRRVIKRITFLYRSVNPREGKATVLVYGDHGRDIRRESRRDELLGQREVDFRADNDVIEVGRSEGRFRKLRVIVRGAPIELRDMKVIFEDNSVLDVTRRSRILRENSDFVIDLPGERRVIQRIDFQYRSVDRREGKATVLVYGRH